MLIAGSETHTSENWKHLAVNTRKMIIFKNTYYEYFNMISTDFQIHLIYSNRSHV